MRRARRAARGFSLVEAIVFIVVVAVLLAGIVVALGTSLRSSPRAGEIDLAAELAQQRMELILAQRRSAGFAAFADQCSPGPGPSECLPPPGYAIASGIAPGGGGPPAYKVIQVNVTGPSEASATALVSDY